MSELDELRHDNGAPAAYSIVEEFWPYDGPHSRDTMASAATAVAELVRYLNNSTQYGVHEAPTLWRIVAQISTAVDRFDQLLDQLAGAAVRLGSDPMMYDGIHAAPAADVADAVADQLIAAREANRELMGRLDQASSLSSRLGHRSEGES